MREDHDDSCSGRTVLTVSVYAPRNMRWGFFVASEAADQRFMKRALELAEKARGYTSPNPMVGAVVVKNGKIIGEGYHHAAGRPHAEIEAMRKAKMRCQGATLYVSLEPCCHTGLTKPCTEAIIKAGIRQVVFAVKDPDRRVNGRGARVLKKAGVEVRGNLMADQARQLNEQYFGYHDNGRPFVTLKLAQSLDGRIAVSSGESRWITGKPARKLAHQLRAQSDAVVVGRGTVLHDNPALTVRHVKGRNPYRVVVTSDPKLPGNSRLLMLNDDGRTIIATGAVPNRRARTDSGKVSLTYWKLKKTRQGMIDLNDLVEKADRFGLQSLLVEGGSRLAGSFVKAGLVDKYVFVVAPMIIGEGVNSVTGFGVKRVIDSVRLEHTTTITLGKDLAIIGYPQRSK